MFARPIPATLASAALILAASAALAQPAWTPAQKDVEILPIDRNFVASKVAATRCNALDAASDETFQANFPAVSAQATQALRARHPHATRAEIDGLLKAVDGEARRTVEAEVARSGCASPQVQRLVQLYKSHRAEQ